MADYTKPEKLLVAAGRLAAAGKSDFTAEDLVVEAHKAFPTDFAMKGYPEYPDSNSILTQVMGKTAPMIVRGWLEKVGVKKYRVTPKGLSDLAALDGAPAISVARVDRRRDQEIGNMLTAAAFDLARAGRAEEITFFQFCRFVGLGAGDKWQKVQGKLQAAEHLADEIEKIGEAGQQLRIFAHNRNMEFEPDDLRLAKPLLHSLQERFKQQMENWRRMAHE